jgi:hypothetical protein
MSKLKISTFFCVWCDRSITIVDEGDFDKNTHFFVFTVCQMCSKGTSNGRIRSSLAVGQMDERYLRAFREVGMSIPECEESAFYTNKEAQIRGHISSIISSQMTPDEKSTCPIVPISAVVMEVKPSGTATSVIAGQLYIPHSNFLPEEFVYSQECLCVELKKSDIVFCPLCMGNLLQTDLAERCNNAR